MSKHTPGTWEVAWAGGRPLLIKAGELHIAKISSQAEETEPNAHLIAAAPDMLEALRATAEWLIANARRAPDSALPVVAKIGAAIAKAEGKS